MCNESIQAESVINRLKACQSCFHHVKPHQIGDTQPAVKTLSRSDFFSLSPSPSSLSLSIFPLRPQRLGGGEVGQLSFLYEDVVMYFETFRNVIISKGRVMMFDLWRYANIRVSWRGGGSVRTVREF